MLSLLVALIDVPAPGTRPTADIAPSPTDGGPGTIATVLVVAAVVVAGVLYFRRRRRRS
ncbi:MAG: hypothetical protein AB7R55_03475 [Gemmatimonadales bacterium]